MRQIRLREYEKSASVALSIEERDHLRVLVPDLTVEAAAGSSNAYILTASSTVGSAVIGDLAIEIAPKIPVSRVIFLLSYALGFARWSEEPFRSREDESLIEAVVPVFVTHVERALRRGILQGYRSKDDELHTVRGRIRFEDQLRARPGMPLPVNVRYDEFTEDILENRLLKAALHALGRIHLRSDSGRTLLRRFSYLLDHVELEWYSPAHVPEVFFTRLNEHYRQAIEWARLILRGSSFESTHGAVTANAVLFDMNAVFETFVRTALLEELRLTEQDFPKGGDCPKLYLDLGRLIRLEPDLSWWIEGECVFVGDLKYKRVHASGVKHPDLYQLLAYTTATALADGLLIYAKGEGAPANHEVVFANKKLHVRALELSGPIEDLHREIELLVQVVRSFAKSPSTSSNMPTTASSDGLPRRIVG